MMESGRVRVARALSNLKTAVPPVAGYASTPIGRDSRVDEVALAKDSRGTFHLLLVPPENVETFDLPLGQVLPAYWVLTNDARSPRLLDVACSDPRLVETFSSLIGEMLDRIDVSGNSAVDELREVLDSWRSIFAKSAAPTNTAQVIGLFGELVVLDRLAEVDPVRAIRAWRGNEGYRHDFYLRNALEVKTYTTLNTPSVSIHGSYQLDPPRNGKLHLTTFRVEEDPEGITVRELIDRITGRGVSMMELLSKSTDDAPIRLDNNLRLSIAEERLYEVGSTFPGIRASRLQPNDLAGVADLQFKLLLDACPGQLDIDEFEAVVTAL